MSYIIFSLVCEKIKFVFYDQYEHSVKVLSNPASVEMKNEHAFITGKKISPFTPAVGKIFNFLHG